MAQIRPARLEDMSELLRVYECARAFMRANGNPTQWDGGYPARELLEEDIAQSRLYIIEEKRFGICGAFMLLPTPDPTYAYIEGGAWRSNTPYGTIHRIASDGRVHGLFHEAVKFARERFDHLRIDTFRDNFPMQHCILKEGFSHRGTIYLENGDPRMAYDWIKGMEV
ncbi:MAG: N-acetyltransferase [Clostridia bacterium]|nr:N-acetyltransferase [Clostridia bacterium]